MRLAVAVLTLAYPFIIYFGLGHFEPRYLAFLIAGLALLRAVGTRQPIWLAAALGALVLGLATFLSNQILPLKLYPVLVSVVMLFVFATSLVHPPSIIERLARMKQPMLPPAGVHYTRQVTIVWCFFFVVNGSIALATALLFSNAVWALYNGLVSYLLMGMLFAGEWLVRQGVKARHVHD